MSATSGAIRAGRAFVEIFADDSRLRRGLKAAERTFQQWGARVNAIGTAIFAAGTLATTAFLGMTKLFADAGAGLSKISTQTGETVENLSKMQFAAERTGVEWDDLVGSMEELNIRLGETVRDGVGPASEAFKQLGIDANALAEMTPLGRLKAIGTELSKIQSESQRGFLTDEIFGGDGFKILPLLRLGGQGIEELTRKAEELGLVMSEKDAKAAVEFSRAMKVVHAQLRRIAILIGASVAPMLTDLSLTVTKNLRTVIDWVNSNRTLVATLFKLSAIAAAVGAGLISLGLLLTLAGGALGALTTIAGAAVAAFQLLISPITLTLAALAALTYAFLRHTEAGREMVENIRSQFAQAFTFVSGVIDGIVNALRSGNIALAGRIAFLGLKVAFLKGIQPLQEIWYGGLQILETAWIDTFSRIERFLIRSSSAIQSVYQSMTNSLAKMLVRAWGMVDPSIDVEATLNELDSMSTQTQAGITRRRDEALQDSYQGQEKARANAEERTGERVAAASRELAEATGQLNRGLAEARKQAAEASYRDYENPFYGIGAAVSSGDRTKNDAALLGSQSAADALLKAFGGTIQNDTQNKIERHLRTLVSQGQQRPDVEIVISEG